MSDHTQADAGRERDPIPTARERDQDRQALSAPWTSPPAPTRTRPPAPRPARSAAGLRLDAWRERGADRMDPVRFRFMEALERRAAPHAGAARALLDQRLAALLDAYAADLERDEAAPGSPAPEPSQAPGREAQDCAAADTPIDGPRPPTPWPAWPARSTPATPCLARRLPELPLLDVYRDIWAKVSANRQLRQSEQQVPDNAGPLNSNNLVHRSLALMRQLSPAICTSSCPTWTRWPGWSSSMARWPLPKPRAVRPRLAPRVRARRLSPPPPSAAGPRRPDAPSDLRRAVPAVRYDPYTNHIRITYMGIVKISEQMHENLRVASAALSRSINSQAEHWMRIGMLSELYPQLRHADICQLLIRIEQAEGFSIAALSQGQPQDAQREAA